MSTVPDSAGAKLQLGSPAVAVPATDYGALGIVAPSTVLSVPLRHAQCGGVMQHLPFYWFCIPCGESVPIIRQLRGVAL